MATATVNHSPESGPTLGYAGLAPLHRAALAREMSGEILDHYDHARTLVAALVDELRQQGAESKAALHLATITKSWLNDQDHTAQETRLTACLSAIEDAARA